MAGKQVVKPTPGGVGENSFAPKDVAFNTETWSKGGLRYFVIGDASATEISSLAKLFKAETRTDVLGEAP